MSHRHTAVSELFHLRSIAETKGHSPFSIPLAQFGCLTFHKGVIEKMLPKEVSKNVLASMKGKEKINPSYMNAIADAMKDWAVNLGATHFCHWFQPLSGKIAEKHDSFLDIGAKGDLIEKFSGKLLFKGEPDASSFPSGGLRKTASARGYTSWDAQTAPFIWKIEGKATLCIPALFFSWNQEALDFKIPLIRSEEKLSEAALRLFRFLELSASYVHPTLGCEQEYFLVARSLLGMRPDLMLCGRTLFGASSAKGQEFEDHYFSSIPEKVLYFMRDVEEKAFHLGIPLKTRHAEVAPSQYEAAPIFERSINAIDHNILLMEIMRQKAQKYGLSCLFHEKPFKGLNGSGKHCNWSLMTDLGMNLLDPDLVKEMPLVFLSSITAVISGIYRYGSLLRATIASPGNELRLGGHEAPPALISVYLGEELEALLNAVENGEERAYQGSLLADLRIASLPDFSFDSMDRNRTTPFAFTGNKFEFRSVGASAHPAFPVSVLNAIVAESLNSLVDEMEKKRLEGFSVEESAMQIIQKNLKESRQIRYLGDNYKEEWKNEAKKRGFLEHKSVPSLSLFLGEDGERVLQGILSKEERSARVSILEDQFMHVFQLEALLMLELFDTQIAPACFEYQTLLAQNIQITGQLLGNTFKQRQETLLHLSEKLEKALESRVSFKKELDKVMQLEGKERLSGFLERISFQMKELRLLVDELEMLVQDKIWPLPKYRELLFSI